MIILDYIIITPILLKNLSQLCVAYVRWVVPRWLPCSFLQGTQLGFVWFGLSLVSFLVERL